MRKKIVAGNWKMNKHLDEGIKLMDEIIGSKELVNSLDVLKIIAPPFIHLSPFVNKLKMFPNSALAAQNCHHELHGAFTGEISASMISSLGATYVIIGHSERRQYFLESNQLLVKKVNVALKEGLSPIFCIGENKAERAEGKHFEVIETQLKESLFHLHATDFEKIVIAYEPVWAIGTGVTATSVQAQEMHSYIRTLLQKEYGTDISSSISILYGGSCNAENAKELFLCEDIDGGLIGGASLNADSFVKIINAFS